MDFSRSEVLKWWSMIRWFMVTVLFAIGMLHLSTYRQTLPSILFIAVFFGIVVLNLLYKVNTSAGNNAVTIIQVILDTVFATMVVHMTGGLNSYFVWIYLIGVITASIMIPQMGGLLAGLIGSVSLFGLIMLYQYGVLVPLSPEHGDISSRTIYILSYTALFCGVAMIANYISDQLSSYARLLKEKQQIIENDTVVLRQTVQTQTKKLEETNELLRTACQVAHMDHDLNTPLCIISLSIGRVKRLGMEMNDEGLLKTSNEITEAINKINYILQRLIPLKTNTLIRNYEEGLAHEQENTGSR